MNNAVQLHRMDYTRHRAITPAVQPPKLISNKELYMGGWTEDGRTISPRTMSKEREKWGLEPVGFDGNMPLFRVEDVEAAKKRRLETRLAMFRRRG